MWVQRDDPFQGTCPKYHPSSPSGLGSTSAVAHLMGGPTSRMDRSRVAHSTGQLNLRISPFYGTLSPTGPSHPTSWVTSNSTGHTLRVRSDRELGHPIGWVALWVQSIPKEFLDTPRSVLVTSHEKLQDIDQWSSILSLWPFSSSQPNSSHAFNETPGLFHSINTRRHATFGDIDHTPLNTLSDP